MDFYPVEHFSEQQESEALRMISRRALLQGCLASTVTAAPSDGFPIGFAIGTYGMKTMKTE